jgi:toxin ParE1/3/4
MAGNDVPSPATFLLTRNAALDLRRIYTRSLREWGDDVADRYLADLYAVMGVGQPPTRKRGVCGSTTRLRF